MKTTPGKLAAFIAELVAEADAVVATREVNTARGVPAFAWVDLEKFKKLRAKCALLSAILPPKVNAWKTFLEAEQNSLFQHAVETLAVLKAIREAADAGLLVQFQELVIAEVFSGLLDQAKYLLEQGYTLAAGVLLRSVLEERTKRLCVTNDCMPASPRPTLNDFNTGLYKHEVYDKITFKHVDAMAAVGNDAAHGKEVRAEDISRLCRDVEEFLGKYST